MKKILTTTVMTVLFFMLLFFPGCQKGKTGTLSASGVDLIKMLPESSTGVIYINFKDLAKLEFFDKMVKEKKSEKPGEMFKDYQDFVNKTGIDPQKDIFAMAFAIPGNMTPGNPEAVGVAKLNYNKEKILKLMKEQNVTLTEVPYKGVTVYKFTEVKENGEVEENAFAFISDEVAALGKPNSVNKVIDLSKGDGKSAMDNPKLKPYIEKFSGLVSFVFDFPGDARKIHDMGMGKIDLTKAEVIVGNFNFKDNAYIGEVNMISPNKEANDQLVNTLNGFKGMASLAGEEAMEVVNKIVITSSADKVTLSFNIPNELLERVSKKLEEKFKKTPMPAEPTEPTETTETPKTTDVPPTTTE
ncbi:MAG TPA: hypothetical protein VK469_14340 [Candidatus Kapabacteria bacterium]|nr:hypothetical protein [Candidatus Kapabacteria bacterium]